MRKHIQFPTTISLVLAALLASFSGTATSDPYYVTTDETSGVTYEFYFAEGGITWTDAEAAALGLGGMLAVLGTTEENDFVAAALNTHAQALYNSIGVGPWLGGYSADGSTFEWVDGSAFTSFGWGPSQPDWYEEGAQGLLYYSGSSYGSLWGDYGQSCGAGGCTAGNVMGYIVEYAVVPEPATLALFGLGLAGIGFSRRKKV